MIKKLLTAAAIGGLLVVGAAAPAHAGSGNWIGGLCGGGYAGSSSYASSTGQSYANTARSGTGCGVKVALRYGVGGQTAGVDGGTANVVSIQRAVVATGGWHQLGILPAMHTTI